MRHRGVQGVTPFRAVASTAGSWDTSDALEALRPWLTRYVAARIGDPLEAEDVVQEVLIATSQAAGTQDDAALALGIARHKTVDWWRTTTRRRAVPSNALPDRADPAPGPAELSETAETVAYVRELLRTLPERDADLLLLRMSGCSAQETGAALHMSPGAVRIAQHRALAKLRARLDSGTGGGRVLSRSPANAGSGKA